MPKNPGKTESSQWIPEGQLLVSDLYEGDRLIPEFDLPRNEYETAKFQKKNGLITYSDPAAKLGVDVSEHQENIDWEQVKAAGVILPYCAWDIGAIRRDFSMWMKRLSGIWRTQKRLESR